MSIFSKIKDAIFGHKSAPAPTQAAPAPQPTATATTTTQAAPPAQAQQPVDVDQVLTQIAREKGNPDLNYKTSIVDLMKLLGIDSDYDARQALAVEMGRDDYSGTAEDNVWLHRRVMQDLGRSGGRVPAEYVD